MHKGIVGDENVRFSPKVKRRIFPTICEFGEEGVSGTATGENNVATAPSNQFEDDEFTDPNVANTDDVDAPSIQIVTTEDSPRTHVNVKSDESNDTTRVDQDQVSGCSEATGLEDLCSDFNDPEDEEDIANRLLNEDNPEKKGELEVKVRLSPTNSNNNNNNVNAYNTFERATSCFQTDMMCYKMATKPRGIAMIIEISEYINDIQTKRLGSKYDVMNLTQLFEQLHFKVEHRSNLTRREFNLELTWFSNHEAHKTSDMMILAILSHGYDGHVIASDGAMISIENVYQKFNNQFCPALRGKPKFFIIQACRGPETDYGQVPRTPNVPTEEELPAIPPDFKSLQRRRKSAADMLFSAFSSPTTSKDTHDDTNQTCISQTSHDGLFDELGHPPRSHTGNGGANAGSGRDTIPINNFHHLHFQEHTSYSYTSSSRMLGEVGRARPTWEDMIIAYSTIPGYASIRDHNTGTWFIQSMVEVFMAFAHEREIVDLLRTTSQRLSKFTNESYEKQTCNVEMRHLYKRIYFNPEPPEDEGGYVAPPELRRSKSTPPVSPSTSRTNKTTTTTFSEKYLKPPE